jgi:hypothetical protein
MWRAATGRGRAGQAFLLGEPSMMDGTTVDSLAADCHAPQQDGQAGKFRLLARSRLRILVQSLRANASPLPRATGRLRNSPHRVRNARKGGRDVPATPAGCDSLHCEHPIQTWMRRLRSRTGRIRIFVFHPIARSLNQKRLPMMHQPVDQGRGQGVVHIEQGAPFPEGSIRA